VYYTAGRSYVHLRTVVDAARARSGALGLSGINPLTMVVGARNRKRDNTTHTHTCIDESFFIDSDAASYKS
jgi:hypothetical protein